ncbi:MAG: beta-lactamase family protein [Gammaproteobacteria bacterium]|nr:beta-lactamase family protein [Gammaproteobacteria bacterium]
MRRFTRLTLAAGLWLLGLPVLNAAPTATRPLQGIALVEQGGRLVHEERSPGIARDSRFLIASISKQITAALVLQAVDRGQLALDTPLVRYWPERSGIWPRSLQVRHLLNHSSGLRAEEQPPAAEPGKTFAYSNLGYQFLGRLLEKQTGKSFATLAGELFARCGMEDTRADGSAREVLPGQDTDPQGRARKLDRPLSRQEVPAGQIVSTARDLLAWNHCLHESPLLSRASRQAMLSASMSREHPIFGRLGYGYGLQIDTSEGFTELGHSGYLPGGYTTLLLYYPESRTSLVVLENRIWPLTDGALAFAPELGLRERVRKALRSGVAF